MKPDQIKTSLNEMTDNTIHVNPVLSTNQMSSSSFRYVHPQGIMSKRRQLDAVAAFLLEEELDMVLDYVKEMVANRKAALEEKKKIKRRKLDI